MPLPGWGATAVVGGDAYLWFEDFSAYTPTGGPPDGPFIGVVPSLVDGIPTSVVVPSALGDGSYVEANYSNTGVLQTINGYASLEDLGMGTITPGADASWVPAWSSGQYDSEGHWGGRGSADPQPQIPNGWPASFTLPGLPLFTWHSRISYIYGQWNTDPADSAIILLTGQNAIDQDYYSAADPAKFYLAVSINGSPVDVYEGESPTGPFTLLGSWDADGGNTFTPHAFHAGDFAAILIDNLFGRSKTPHPMELTERLNKLASDRSTAGKQNALLAIAALVLLDKDNNVQFDADDLPGTLARILAAGDVALPSGKTIGTDEQPYAGEHSYQPLSPDLNLDPAAGSTVDNPKFLAATMGNIIGDSLTKEGAYLAGLIGALSILGVRATKYQIAALLGIVMDGVTDADAAVLAVIDGSDPSSVTRARAAFAVAMNNNNAGSGVDYGLDLRDDAATRLAGAFSGTAKPFAIAKALTRSPNEVCQLESADVPVDGTTGLNFAGKGSKCVDYTHGEEYINTGTKAAPVWKKLTHA